MRELLTVLMTWLYVGFGLPPAERPPQVEFVTPERMMEIRLGASRETAGGSHGAGVRRPSAAGATPKLYAIYDDRSRTIYLPDRWAAGSPADMSMLVHELVHHLQNTGNVTYACAAARERPAYQAQARWLELFGKTLADEFAVDAMTILLRTRCMR